MIRVPGSGFERFLEQVEVLLGVAECAAGTKSSAAHACAQNAADVGFRHVGIAEV